MAWMFFAELSQQGWANQTHNDTQLNGYERDGVLRTAWVVLYVNSAGEVKCAAVKDVCICILAYANDIVVIFKLNRCKS